MLVCMPVSHSAELPLAALLLLAAAAHVIHLCRVCVLSACLIVGKTSIITSWERGMGCSGQIQNEVQDSPFQFPHLLLYFPLLIPGMGIGFSFCTK